MIVETHALMCDDVGQCIGDVDNNAIVNVNDLLAIINSWGACAPPSGQTECYECLADIDPFHKGNGIVNVNDLLAVINNWGCGGVPSSMPQSISDCFNFCSEFEGETWQRCLDGCFASVCERNPSECQ